ncbi:MAG: MaoC family dehydratase, partial [Actinomycetota bacterium]
PLSMALLTHPDFPLPVLGLVHVANRVLQSRRLRFDEELAFTAWVDGPRPHRRGTTVDVHLTASVGDAVAWAGVSTYLATGLRVAEGEPAERARDESEPGPGRHVWTLPADTGRRYAEVSGDRNPIHTSRMGAKFFGFPRPIAHGMYTAARALAEVPVPRGGSLDWAVVFGKPVVLPARVVLEFGDVPGGTTWQVASARSGKTHLAGHVLEPASNTA